MRSYKEWPRINQQQETIGRKEMRGDTRRMLTDRGSYARATVRKIMDNSKEEQSDPIRVG